MGVPPDQLKAYRAAHDEAAWADLSTREQLKLTGPDRVSFLQGMVTNDVEALPVGGSCYAAMLTVKGGMVTDLRVLKLADALIVDVGPGLRQTAVDFLNKYLISEEAEVVAAPELAMVRIVGPQRDAVIKRLEASVVLGSLPAQWGEGVDVLVPRSEMNAVRQALGGVPELSELELSILRVEQGVPVFGIDMTETTIPLEASLDHAINYKKGCYIGQEVIARGTYRGQMNKKLVGLLLGDAMPEKGVELRIDERRVGRVTTVVESPKTGQHIALGYVHRDFLAPGTSLSIATGGTAVVCALPFAAPGV